MTERVSVARIATEHDWRHFEAVAANWSDRIFDLARRLNKSLNERGDQPDRDPAVDLEADGVLDGDTKLEAGEGDLDRYDGPNWEFGGEMVDAEFVDEIGPGAQRALRDWVEVIDSEAVEFPDLPEGTGRRIAVRVDADADAYDVVDAELVDEIGPGAQRALDTDPEVIDAEIVDDDPQDGPDGPDDHPHLDEDL